MATLLSELNALTPDTLTFLGVVVKAIASLLAVIIVGFFAKPFASIWLSARDKQDKEVEWRNHAIELTKLNLEGRMKLRETDHTIALRPSILDFLANYRDLQELGAKSPKELYSIIESSRIKKTPKTTND